MYDLVKRMACALYLSPARRILSDSDVISERTNPKFEILTTTADS